MFTKTRLFLGRLMRRRERPVELTHPLVVASLPPLPVTDKRHPMNPANLRKKKDD